MRIAWRALALAVLVPLGCAKPPPLTPKKPAAGRPPAPTRYELPDEAPPFHLSALATSGDGARRASIRLVLDGLAADDAGDSGGATRQYQRALQVDPANPYAYLALARSWLAQGDAPRALSFLDKAEALLGAQRARDPSVDGVLTGLRAESLAASGRTREAAPLKARARALAPDVWDDGQLDPGELR